MSKLRQYLSKAWVLLLIGAVVGTLAVLGIRFFTYHTEDIHYHANFAVYINGQREQFNNPKYYEEEATCNSGQGISSPAERAHMHDGVNSVAHVEDHAVTWGQFFENLGWVVGPDFIQKADGTIYATNGQAKLHIVIDNQDYTDLTPITNVVIKDRSRLLISYGDASDSQLQQEYKTVPATAGHYDTAKDPASCSGSHGATWHNRMQHMF